MQGDSATRKRQARLQENLVTMRIKAFGTECMSNPPSETYQAYPSNPMAAAKVATCWITDSFSISELMNPKIAKKSSTSARIKGTSYGIRPTNMRGKLHYNKLLGLTFKYQFFFNRRNTHDICRPRDIEWNPR